MIYVVLAIGAVVIFLLAKGSARVPAPPTGGDVKGPPVPSGFYPQPGDSLTWTAMDLKVLAQEVCEEEDYPRVGLVKAICGVESAWDPMAINRGDHPPSVGLMGLKVPTAQPFVPWVGREEDLYDPPTNLRAGIRFLKNLESKWFATYGQDGIIQMYNLGEPRFLHGERSAAYLARVKAKLPPDVASTP